MLFLYVRRRVGEWLALAAILPILFLGPSWDDLLFPFQMALFGSVACGIGALLLLERRDRLGTCSRWACCWSRCSSSTSGIPFVAGGDDRARASTATAGGAPSSSWSPPRSGCSGTPAGATRRRRSSPSTTSRDRPSYILDGLAPASRPARAGLERERQRRQPAGLGAAAAGAGARAWWSGGSTASGGRLPRLLGVAVAPARLLVPHRRSTRTRSPGRPTAGRYQYLGIVLMALRGLRAGRGSAGPALTPAVAWSFVGAAAALSNGAQLRDAANGLAGIAQQQRGGLAALELARGRVDPRLRAHRAELRRRLSRRARCRLLFLGDRRLRIARLHPGGAGVGARSRPGSPPTRSSAAALGSGACSPARRALRGLRRAAAADSAARGRRCRRPGHRC